VKVELMRLETERLSDMDYRPTSSPTVAASAEAMQWSMTIATRITCHG